MESSLLIKLPQSMSFNASVMSSLLQAALSALAGEKRGSAITGFLKQAVVIQACNSLRRKTGAMRDMPKSFDGSARSARTEAYL